MLDSARFYLQILGGLCAAEDYIRFEQRIDAIQQFGADNHRLASERGKKAAELHRDLADAVERQTRSNP